MLKHRGTILFLAGALAALGAGWRGFPVAMEREARQPVDFSHKIHVEKAGTRCEDCHALRDDGSFTGAPALDKCSGCHAQAMGTSTREKRFIDDYVASSREIPWQAYARQPWNVHFSHAAHLKLGQIACRQCHGAMEHSDTLPAVRVNRISGYSTSPHFQEMGVCEDCHRRRGAAGSCLACHQ